MFVSHKRTLSFVLLMAGCTVGRSEQPAPVTIDEPEPPHEDPPHIVQLPSVELEPVFELDECGEITNLVPLDGRIYGVANGGATACAFDLDERGEDLRLDRLWIDDEWVDGVTAQLVEAGGVQTIAALWWGGSPDATQLGLFERTSAGVTVVRSEPARGEQSPARIDLVRDRRGKPLVVYSAQTTIPGCSVEPASLVTETMLWTPLSQGHESASGHFVDRAVASEHGLVLAGTGPVEADPFNENEPRCYSYIEVNLFGPSGWRSDAGAPSYKTTAASVLDVIALGDHWLVLAECDHGAWLASLSARDGEIAWLADVGTAVRGRFVESPDGSVEMVLYVHLRSGRRLLVRQQVGAEGRLGPERVVQFALDAEVWVRTMAITQSGRVWLGGRVTSEPARGDHAWLGFVEFP